MKALAPRISRLLDAAYSEPDPLYSAEEFERLHHDDVAARTLDQIDAERILARLRWAITVYHGGDVSTWLSERIVRLDRAAERLRNPAPRR